MHDDNEIQQITDNRYYDGTPMIDDAGQIIWKGNSGAKSEIYTFNGSEITQLTSNSEADKAPRVHGETAIWLELVDSYYQAVFFDGVETTRISTNNNRNEDLQLGAGTATWRGHDGNDFEIFYFNGIETIQLTDNDRNDYKPRVNILGEIVWHGYDDGSDTEIFHFDGITISILTDNDRYDGNAVINDMGVVAWQSGDYENSEIFLASPTDKINSAPEPGTMVLTVFGLLAIATKRRKF